MKKYIFIALTSLCIITAGSSCKNPTQNAIKAEAVIIKSVDTGMQIWKDQVIAGKATQSQVDEVKKAYEAYYGAQQIAKAAIEKSLASGSTNSTDVVTANDAVSNAETSLLYLLNQYIKH